MRTVEQELQSLPSSRRSIPTYVSGKIQKHHLDKLAVVYVRQSTPRQVLEHHESTELQYKLASRAVALGWPQDRVLVIDDDLGQSGATAENRAGFQRLLAEIGLSHVGLVLGMEMSRLARSCKDWHPLLELCAVFGALLADLDVRKVTLAYRRFIIWADAEELDRLRRLHNYRRRAPHIPYPSELITPKRQTGP